MVSIRLHVTSLKDPPPYTAVSYIWGEASPTKEILLNGQTFTVRQNIWDFLIQLRASGYNAYFWIDAISIDQTNISERNHQVTIMGSIYTQAEKTIAWLGTTTDEIAIDVQALTKIYEQRDRSKTSIAPHAAGCKRILAHPYWTRTWIFQEYILSTDVEFWCGNWTMKATVLGWIVESRAWYKSRALTDAQRMAAMIVVHVFAHVTRFHLVSLLEMTRYSICADPRDRIYALLSLLTKKERRQWAIIPDYAKSTQTLCQELFRVLQDTEVLVQRHGRTLGDVKEWLRDTLFLEEGPVENGD
jgi:hypothetical protein